MDTIFIDELRVDALIGIHDWERLLRQPLRLSLVLEFDNRKPAASGELAHTLDYGAITTALRDHVAASSDGLLEQLAESCCALLAQRFGATFVDLRIDKPLAALNLGCARVGIRIQRRFA